MPTNPNDVRARLLDLLLAKVAADTFPSATMMDLVEELLQPDDVPAYAAVLMEKIYDDVFPSIPLMQRVLALT